MANGAPYCCARYAVMSRKVAADAADGCTTQATGRECCGRGGDEGGAEEKLDALHENVFQESGVQQLKANGAPRKLYGTFH